jgi:hypothetical protein
VSSLRHCRQRPAECPYIEPHFDGAGRRRLVADDEHAPHVGRPEDGEGVGSSPLAELMARQKFVGHVVRQERLVREVAADEALVRSANSIAWHYARQCRHGFLPQPSLNASGDELTGWRLARRGFDSPPTWLLQEGRDGSIR